MSSKPLRARTAVGDTAGATLLRVAGKTADLLRGVSDPKAAVPGLQWTLAETGAHLVAELRDHTACLTGDEAQPTTNTAPAGDSPAARSAVANAEQLRHFAERDPTRLAELLILAADDYVATAGRLDPDQRCTIPNGLRMTVSAVTATLVGEQLVHGLDIARAAGRPWQVERRDALLVADTVITLLPAYLDHRTAAGSRMTFRLHLRGGSTYRFTVDHGMATVTDQDGPADCRISADPVAFLLVGYGRIGQWSQVVRGRITAGGRKPWLASRFGALTTAP